MYKVNHSDSHAHTLTSHTKKKAYIDLKITNPTDHMQSNGATNRQTHTHTRTNNI